MIEYSRKTGETDIAIGLCIDGSGRSVIDTGVGFMDHLLATLALHARFDLELSCRGDLHVDDHHTVEDCGLALGAALDKALEERRGIARFGWALVPMDEALARAVVDLSGRPFARVRLGLKGPKIGALSCENIEHFVRSFATAGRFCIHLDVIRGANDHHRAEAAFKAAALALRAAVAGTGTGEAPSLKGTLV